MSTLPAHCHEINEQRRENIAVYKVPVAVKKRAEERDERQWGEGERLTRRSTISSLSPHLPIHPPPNEIKL